mmetsp:Transcript_19157/g.30530  ORF Transcript_19157/g.30530 Transcript_19157/m.30530 type:complete len:107 (+) Transcript_19157:332-652(+)
MPTYSDALRKLATATASCSHGRFENWFPNLCVCSPPHERCVCVCRSLWVYSPLLRPAAMGGSICLPTPLFLYTADAIQFNVIRLESTDTPSARRQTYTGIHVPSPP